jgi:hypothetical protein
MVVLQQFARNGAEEQGMGAPSGPEKSPVGWMRPTVRSDDSNGEYVVFRFIKPLVATVGH